MLSTGLSGAWFLNMFFNNTLRGIKNKVINFEEGSYLIEKDEFVKLHNCCVDCDLIINADGTKAFHKKIQISNIVWTKDFVLERSLPENCVVEVDEVLIDEDGTIQEDILRYALSEVFVFSPETIGSYFVIE